MATKAQEVRPARRAWIGYAVAAAALLAAAGLAARAVARRSLVLAAIPERPDMSALPPEFASQVGDSEQRARSYLHSVDGLVALSRLYHANGFYNEALQCYSALWRMEPRDARWPHLEANIYAQFGRQDDALPREQAAVRLAPGYIPARLRLGDELLKGNQVADAVRAYSEVLARAPDDPYALLGLAKADVIAGEWNKARDRLLYTKKLNPDFIGGLSTLVTVDEHLGNQAEADEVKAIIGRREFKDLADPWLDGLMDDCFDSYRLSVAASVASLSGNRPGAEQMLERAIAFAPKSSSFHRQLAVMLTHDGNFPSAVEHLQRAVAISPTDNDAWLVLYQALVAMRQSGPAEQALRSGLANCPDSASLHIEEAKRLNDAGEKEAAIAEYRDAFRLNPSESGPLIELANIYFSLNRGDEALAALNEALEKQPENPQVIGTLAFYYINAGNEALALQWWDHVRRQPRMPPEMVQALRQAYQQHFGRELN